MNNLASIYQIDPKMMYKSEEVWFPLSEDNLNGEEDFHKFMLNDHLRMISYEAAVKKVIKPGMTVVDVGTGTGILALWALEAGAKKVYGIDLSDNVIKFAVERMKKAGLRQRFEAINAVSYNVELPERVDVIISEIIGNVADNEDMIPILNDARKRFLKPNGKMIPKMVKSYIVPISSPKAYKQVKAKSCRGINKKYNLNDLLSKLNIKNQFDLYYDVIIPKSIYLSSPQMIQHFNFEGKDRSEYGVKLIYRLTKKGVLTGFKGYFVAQLSDQIVMDISGDDIKNRKASDSWKHCYFPIEKPIDVQAGDVLELIFSRYYPKSRQSLFRKCYSWKGNVQRDRYIIGEFAQDMLGGK